MRQLVQQRERPGSLGVAIVDHDERRDGVCNGKAAKGKFESRKVDLKDYDNGVLPLQNVDSNGALNEVADMVKLPYLHEVSTFLNISFHCRNDFEKSICSVESY